MASPESLPVPRPKSPPELYGKRRDLAKVVMLEREIGFLQEELKSIETLQPASSCIKEVADYVITNPEPLVTTSKKSRKSCRFWKWLCGKSCFNMSWICCCYKGCCCVETPSCCCSAPDCCSCSLPKCNCCACKPPGCPTCLKACLCCFPKCKCKCNCSCSCYPKCPDCDCSCLKCCFPCWPTKCSCSCPKLPKCFCSSCRCCSLNCCYSSCQCC